MQQNLEKILSENGFTLTQKTIPFPRREDFVNHPIETEINRVYHQLGGQLDSFSLNLQKWDMEVDGVAVELDEHLHFNRYRGLTLESSLYQDLTFFLLDDYKSYCKDHESDCIRACSHVGKWSNSSCERQFGEAGPHKELTGPGAPRWKQRAFYDYVKDSLPLLGLGHLLRVSIWEEVHFKSENIPIHSILKKYPHGGDIDTVLVNLLGHRLTKIKEQAL
jgi:hypothetical protein